MKTKHFIILTFTIGAISFAACEDSITDHMQPVVTNLEIGHEDTIHIGEPLHLDFEVMDNDILDFYQVTIHAENEDGYEHKNTLENMYWDYDTTFTEIHGLRNYIVYHHKIVVPQNIEPTHYHFHLKVADVSGNVTQIERELYATNEENDHDEH